MTNDDDDELAITAFFFVEYLLEDDRKRPKYVGRLPNVCLSLYLIIVQAFVTCLIARNVDNFKTCRQI